MNDEGLIEIQRQLDAISHGDAEIRVKVYNGHIAKVEIPYVKRMKLDYTKALAYYMEKLRDAQTYSKDTTFTITTDVKQGGTVYVMDSGFNTKIFKIQP
jgi:hypothetical protein